MGRYYSYLLPKQAGGTPQILVDKTSRMTGRLRVYFAPWIYLNVRCGSGVVDGGSDDDEEGGFALDAS